MTAFRKTAGQAARIYNKFEVLCTAGSIFTGQLKADFSVNSAKICQKEVANQLAVWHIGGMTRPYFVMLTNQDGTRIVPLVDEEGDLVMFSHWIAADEAGRTSLMGSAFGYEVFKQGDGE